MLKVSISNGNSKMGAIPSVSLPPIVTCAAGALCAKKCYAAKIARLRPNVRNAYDRNYSIYLENFNEYFRQVENAVKMSRFFRFHVSGDFPDSLYLCECMAIAARNPHCEILIFTKQYAMVNTWLDQHKKPENVHLIFSAWPGMEMVNPHNLPVANVIFKGQEPAENWKICGGNCFECACRGLGCWELKNGESVAFYEH